MGFFVQLTDAIAERQSLLVTGLDPNPEMLHSWAQRHGMGGRSFLSQARHWIKTVIDETAPHVCAYKPSLGFYQALGPVGLELLLEVRDLVPRELPLIVDTKHGDLNSSSALAHYLFKEFGADAVTLSPLAGQDIAAPFLLYPGKAVVMTCHSSNQAAVLLEVGTSDPTVLARVRAAAPQRFLILRSLWSEDDNLKAMLEAGLSAAADGLLLPLPQNLLIEDAIGAKSQALKEQINSQREAWLESQSVSESGCALWLPQPPAPAEAPVAKPAVQRGMADHLDEELANLVVELFDIGCLLFGEYVQASGAIFNYYIDLRQIISDPNLFHRVLHAYAGQLEGLMFDRIAGIPYGSLPTATGLSLQLHKPLIYPRKEVKAHGARRLIEGDFNEGDHVVVVDDILITGGSVLEAIAKLESSGLVVRDVVVFLDHGGDHQRQAKERLAAAGYRFHAVVTIEQITAVLHAAGRLSDAQAATLQPGSH
ncbi:MAG: orotate phosphoribosyltransferase [Synechococcaceae bacterium WB9_2_170]|nr:orotate phosphoribosyltransferase [Synechococcaceae bacterium WB9_2_170]